MEQELVAKVEELMSSLDSAREYKEIAKAMIDSSLILLSVTLMILSVILIFNLLELLGYINTFFIIPFIIIYPITFYLLLLIIPVGIIIGRRRYSRKMENWREILKEGTPGAIRLLTELDWKKTFEDLRTMKWAIFARVIGGIIIRYIFIQLLMSIVHYIIVLFLFFPSFYLNIIYTYLDLIYLLFYLIPIPIAIYTSKSDIKKYYQKLGSVDYLIWSLRWLYNEFKGMKFEA